MSENKSEKAADDVSSTDFRGTLYASIILDAKSFPHETVAEHIKYEDLCTDETVTKGVPLPKDAHITVKLGLDPATTKEQLRKALSAVKPFVIGIGGGLGCFHNSGKFDDGKVHERDILWANVAKGESQGLQQLRDALAPFALKDKPDERSGGYKPHVTLAFLEFGKGEAYTKNQPLLAALGSSVLAVESVLFKVLGNKTVPPFEIELGVAD